MEVRLETLLDLFSMKWECLQVCKPSIQKNFDHLINSGLYSELTQKKLLIKHSEVKEEKNIPTEYKKLLVEKIPFISYPYEWSFANLKTHCY